MAKNYTTVNPVKQMDDMACWAASMQWWLSYMSPKRSVMNQLDIIAIPKIAKHTYYPEDSETGNADSNFGGLTKDGMKAMFNHPPFKMQYKKYGAGSLKMSSIKSRLKKSPVLIIYYDSTVGGYHANVIVSVDEIFWGLTESVRTMEPRNPSFESRFLSCYTSNEVYLGWAK